MAQKKSIILTLLSLLIITMTGGGAFVFHQYSTFIKTPAGSDTVQKLFTISSGQSLKKIAANLKTRTFITNDRFFIWLAKIKRADKKLQAGEYLLSASKTPEQILTILLQGKVRLYKLTIPEGLNMKEVAGRVAQHSLCSSDQFVSLCHDPVFIQSLGIEAKSLEGYLFPDTYYFPGKAKCRIVISTMVSRFNDIFTAQWKERTRELGFSIAEIVTLASIIEKETGDASERPVIASVFHNRLKKHMRLESDPTVIYGIKNFDGNIKKKHLQMWTPYNTYQIKGLPAGPIANPGAQSIRAALYPEKTDYLFFVSKKDTTHYFSKTIQEHNRAVRKYQLGK
jgi:UPF0755 protein